VDDREAFTRWASERQLALLRTAVLVCGDRQRAEDLVQEALTQVALRWRQLQHGHPDAYARRVIVRAEVSWWRKHRRESIRDDVDRGLAQAQDSDRRLMLAQALARLTPHQRAVIVLRYYVDLTERDAATQLGVSVGTVKSQTHLALRRLRENAPELEELLREGDPP